VVALHELDARLDNQKAAAFVVSNEPADVTE
jgi:hypothetical protein